MASLVERMDRLLATATNAETQNRFALRRLIAQMIRSRIGGGQATTELVDSSLRILEKYFYPDARVRTRPLRFESNEANKIRLSQAHQRVSLEINRMSTQELFSLYVKLKNRRALLVEILEAIPSLRYVQIKDEVAVVSENERKTDLPRNREDGAVL